MAVLSKPVDKVGLPLRPQGGVGEPKSYLRKITRIYSSHSLVGSTT